jgi:aerobic-type carbon monoxide dehydrogenase small subunit (CoxS/CutS family)
MASFMWNGQPVSFSQGETLAAALLRASADRAGTPGAIPDFRYFCGIGACQSCVVLCDGRLVEACITPAEAGACVSTPDA